MLDNFFNSKKIEVFEGIIEQRYHERIYLFITFQVVSTQSQRQGI